MRRRTTILFALVLVLVPWLAARGARAQSTGSTAATTTSTTTALPCTATPGGQPVVSVSQQIAPERFVNNQDLGISTRPMAQNPNGINFDDCNRNMVLEFKLTACNFNGTQNLQVWASKTSDCSQPADRGQGAGGATAAICWPVSQGVTALNQAQGGTNITVNVRDIVGRQNTPGPNLTSNGPEACFAQPDFLQVPINVNFVPVDSTGASVGPAYKYTITTDLVGPNPPAVGTPKAGDTLITMNWTPRTDSDTAGYDIVIDPIPGKEPATAAATNSGVPTVVTVCPDSGSAEEAGLDGTVASTLDATVSSADASGDAGCYTITQTDNSGSTSSQEGACSNLDPVLMSGATVLDAGTPSAPVGNDDDEAGTTNDLLEAGVSNTGAGGIWTPPKDNIVNPNPTIGSTVTGQTTSTYTITGLKNGFTYHLVVASVDNSGNVGPPSDQVCDFPGPVNDFWTMYRTAGGQAGGGLCALEAPGAPATTTFAFGAAAAMAAAGMRRRRNRRGERQ